MTSVTIELTDEMVEELMKFAMSRNINGDLPSIARQALSEFLAARKMALPAPGFRITPAESGSGLGDLSISHDR
jgi:hypothetical protein